MNKLTKTITFGAAAVALFTLCYAVFAIDEGVTQEIVSLVAVMPLALYACLYDIRAAAVAVAAALGLSLFLVQPTIYITYTIPNAIIGLTLGIMVLRTKPLFTLITVSGLNFLHFIYEILVTKYVFRIDAFAEYTHFIDSITAFFADGTRAAALAHDMAFCLIPTLFLVAAAAKAVIFGVTLLILLKRLFKKNVALQIPQIRLNERALSYVFLASEVLTAAAVILTLTGVMANTFICAVILDIELVFMYLFLIYHLFRLGRKLNMRTLRGAMLSMLVIVFFPVSDNYFAVKRLTEKDRD